jgi:glycosyltransferase involved in cell wall biosynthesis
MTQLARLGVYQDGPFRFAAGSGAQRLAPDPVDAPFLGFVWAVGNDFGSTVLFARIESDTAVEPPVVVPADVRVVRLPDYGDLTRLPQVVRAAASTAAAFWRGLREVDVLWAFGPHPFQLMLVCLAVLRGKRVVLGVRQDTREYFRARLPSGRWRPLLALVDAMDLVHRILARWLPVTVVGAANAERYSEGRAPVLAMYPSLVPAAAVLDEPPNHDWDDQIEIEIVTVGRIDAEKNPLLLVDALARLERERPGRYRLRWVGVGPLADAVRARAQAAGVADRMELLGYVAFGPELLQIYRDADMFVHVSLTEGVPQVLAEAMGSGLPIVATDVGGVGAALYGGEAGLLVPPADLEALTGAMLRLSGDARLRRDLVARGLELARERTMEAEAARVAGFLRPNLLS